MSNRRSNSYSPNVRMPGSTLPRPNRAVFALALCLLLPPVGLLFLWRMGVFRTRGRMIVTGIVTLEMLIVGICMLPQVSPDTVTPVPVSPTRVTPAPESSVLTWLSNMDEILKAQQAAENPDATLGPSAAELLAQEEAALHEIKNTIVYAVYGDSAIRYHAAPVCGNQSNRRELTVEQARQEALAPCPDCNPPTFGFTSTVAGAPD